MPINFFRHGVGKTNVKPSANIIPENYAQALEAQGTCRTGDVTKWAEPFFPFSLGPKLLLQFVAQAALVYVPFSRQPTP